MTSWGERRGLYEILAGWIKKREARGATGPGLSLQRLSGGVPQMTTRDRGARGAECNNFVTHVMAPGELFLEVLSSGVITQKEIDWVLAEQGRFPRAEQAAAQRLGRLLDQGGIRLGCRI